MRRKITKQNKPQYHRKKEFHYHDVFAKKYRGRIKNIRHPTYVFLEKGNYYIYVTITHSNYVKGVIVKKLRKNPNPIDKKTSFYVVEFRKDTKNSFGRRLDKWKMDVDDDNDIRKLYEENKKR